MFIKNKFQNLTLFFIMIFVFATNPVYALESPTSNPVAPTNLKIFYYRDNKNARKSLFQHPKYIDVLAPQAYSFDSQGTLQGSIDPKVLVFAHKNNIKIMPLVTNGKFDQTSLRTVLTDESKQQGEINMLVAEAQKNNFWGWQLDFEQMNLSYRDQYSAFAEKFGNQMKKNGLVSSVAVIAQVSQNSSDYPENLWQRIIGVYDYPSLSSSTDFLSVMSYDDPGSTGPVARYFWFQQVIKFSTEMVPKEKLSIGIALYYWKWNTVSGKLVGIGGYQGIQEIKKKYHTKSGYSLKEQAPFISYVNRKKSYKIWYENSSSIKKKIHLIKTYGLHSLSAWALGFENPNIYSALSKF